ncbi:MAG: hypothetical protein ICV73_20230 [Acetobacteraceae bacterium]|nr:hypothetical protein [Acetobacteraceae bacterium]
MSKQKPTQAMTRPALEAAAKKYGVTTAASMTERSIAEAIAEKLSPGAYKFAGHPTDAYALTACEMAIAAAEKATAKPPAPAPAAVEASAPPRQEAPPRPVTQPVLANKERARDKMIRGSMH